MKVGLSLSRCILEIIEGKVDKDDVLIIITRTDFDPLDDEQWTNVWNGYTWHGCAWRHHSQQGEDKFRSLVIELHQDGKIHQPRQYTGLPMRRQTWDCWNWLETVVPDEDVEKNPAVKKAWCNYKILAGLS